MQAYEQVVEYQLFVGVDIAALTATVAWQAPKQKPSKPIIIEQTPEGFSSLHQRLLRTGARARSHACRHGSHRDLLVGSGGFPGAHWIRGQYCEPCQAHHFTKALLKRAKTDAIDAQTLTQLAALLQPDAWTPPPAI